MATLEPTTLSHRPLFGERETARLRRVRAAAWRALELGRAVFGSTVTLRLRPAGGGGRLAGLLHLDVPFEDLADHRVREDVFTACAGRDPLLSRTHLVFVFNPVPAEAGAATSTEAAGAASPAEKR